jgi:hypothetical protein
MRKHFHAIATIIAISGLTLSMAAPAAAFGEDDGDRPNKVPIVFDVFVMRPVGLVLTVAGGLVYGATIPVALLTRPSDVLKATKPLVVRPARFTFVDPIGYHP